MEAILKKEKLSHWIAALQKRGEGIHPRLRRRCLGIPKVSRHGCSAGSHRRCAPGGRVSVSATRGAPPLPALERGAPEPADSERKIEPAVRVRRRPPAMRAAIIRNRQGLRFRFLRSRVLERDAVRLSSSASPATHSPRRTAFASSSSRSPRVPRAQALMFAHDRTR